MRSSVGTKCLNWRTFFLASISGLTPAVFARRNPSDVAQLLFAKANAVEHDTIRKARLPLARLLGGECMKMPQLYSANTRIRRVARIVGNQVDRMVPYLQKVHRTSRSDPFDTIWAIMGAYDPEREGA
jgi:hypothetical protein